MNALARPALRAQRLSVGAAVGLLPASLLLAACDKAAPPPGTEASNPAPSAAEPPAAAADADRPVQHLKASGQLGPGAGELLIDLKPPKHAKLTLDAPVWAAGGGGIGLRFPETLKGALGSHELPLRLPIVVEDGATGPANVELSYFWCTDDAHAACRQESAQLRIALDLSGDAAGGEAHVAYAPPSDAL